MAPREIMEKSLEEDYFSSHTHELDLLAGRITRPGEEKHTIPDRYDLDRCALLMVNPHRLFFYWEISNNTKHGFGITEESVMQLCVMREDVQVCCEDVRGDVGSYYLSVHEPFAVLYAVLLWTGPDGITRVVMRSKNVTFPNDQYREGEFWMDKNGTPLLKASLDKHGVSSGNIFSSSVLHAEKEKL